jgi:hypothetical protein
MRTHARRFRSIFHRHPALPPRAALPLDPEPVVLRAPDSAHASTPALRVKAWLRFGAHTLFAVLWVALPQLFGASRGRESEPLVVEVERACACDQVTPARVGPSLRDLLAPKDDAFERGEAAGFVSALPAKARPPAGNARGACEDTRGAPRDE